MSCPGHLCTCKHLLSGIYEEFQAETGIYPLPTDPTRAFCRSKTVPGATETEAKKESSKHRGAGSPSWWRKGSGTPIQGHQSPGSAGGFLCRPGRSWTPQLKRIDLDKQWQVTGTVNREDRVQFRPGDGSTSQLLRSLLCGRTKNDCPNSIDRRLIKHLLCARHILSKELIRRYCQQGIATPSSPSSKPPSAWAISHPSALVGSAGPRTAEVSCPGAAEPSLNSGIPGHFLGHLLLMRSRPWFDGYQLLRPRHPR